MAYFKGKKFRVFIEKYWPYALSAVVVMLCARLKITRFHIPHFPEMLNSFIGMGSIIIGFLATMVSVLIAAVGRSTMRRIEKNNSTELLTEYINVAIVTGLLAALYSVIFNAFLDDYESIYWYLFLLLIFIIVLFLSATYRIINYLLMILSNIAKENKDNQANMESKVMDSKGFKSHFDN